jgi:hypothetical protein
VQFNCVCFEEATGGDIDAASHLLVVKQAGAQGPFQCHRHACRSLASAHNTNAVVLGKIEEMVADTQTAVVDFHGIEDQP